MKEEFEFYICMKVIYLMLMRKSKPVSFSLLSYDLFLPIF